MPKLIVTGSGIKSIAHITEETKKVINNADKVLFLVNEDLLKAWISREAKESESLDAIYFSTSKRIDAYEKITQYIIEQYKAVPTLCVVFYGHPTVFADSALKAVKEIQANGGEAIILPAVSSLDCLFSDLQIDPGNQGCFFIDATELLVYERRIDNQAHVILWQSGNLGTYDTSSTAKISVLYNYLRQYYDEKQQLCIYEAALYPTFRPRIEWITLKNVTSIEINAISTLYIPPSRHRSISSKYLEQLGMDINNFMLSAQFHTSTE